MQVRRDARVGGGSFHDAARHVNEMFWSAETARSRGIFGHVMGAKPSVALRRCGPCETSVPIAAGKRVVLVCRCTR